MKSKLAKERDKFLESHKGKKLCNGTAAGQYLENRVVVAFLSGVAVGKRLQQYDTPDANKSCWLCGESKPEPDTEIMVECETPGGKGCPPKEVKVHFGCYMDINP